MSASLVSRYQALVIAGPTAVGKSEFAVEVARQADGEIVGADAFQIYRGWDLLTAKPSAALQARVPHHLIGAIPLGVSFDVAQYLALAGPVMEAIRARGKTPVVAGGSGMYIRALLRGLDDVPASDPAIRASLEGQPLDALQRQLAELDPAAAARIDLKNPRRVVRALEVCLTTGKPFSSFRQEWDAPMAAEYGAVLLRDRTVLNERIDRRVEEMFRDGLVEEIAATGEEPGPTARQTLGWREIQRFLAGEWSRDECIAAIQQATRQYAKRQLTWFRKETGLKPLDLGGARDMPALAGEVARMRR